MTFINLLQRAGCLLLLTGAILQANGQKPVKVILDTDIGPDYDDVGAMAVLHSLADKGEAEILATISCNHHYLTGPTLQLFNTYFKRPGIAVGVPKFMALSMGASQKWPQELMTKYPHRNKANDEFPDAVKVYRELLAKAADTSITVIAVGFLTNLSDLLHSPADKISPLTGKELVEKKVKHLVSMAGRFPSGREFNVYKDTVSAAYAIQNWPTPVYFSGWEIGNEVHTGLNLSQNKKISRSPVKDVYARCIPMAPIDSSGRMSWDQTAVLAGVRGAANYFNTVRGRFVLLDNGKNVWENDPAGKHYYYTFKMSPAGLSDIIEELMTR
ncbi:nucleoside hydrolase [Niabella hibiscisoli]|uniref:nucleoside hydrolase n=1 Tax=Niabella hibiscisoli TaxID=1825928 RepID=UPI001F11642D|nr:nucleoside hydrolase [Niabella hibiscisoli]MCH5719039.1 nucleoside hydrolase [Niabella hibiscisoli]